MKDTLDIVIVGVGALGSHLLQAIRNLDARITIIDFDRVEQKNVLSQFHSKQGIGRNKAQATQGLMRMLFGIPIKGVFTKLTRENEHELLHLADIVVDCTDNAAARTIIQTYCEKTEKPSLHGALAADGQFGKVSWRTHFNIDPDDGEGLPTCEDGEHLPFIQYTATLMALELQRYIATGEKRGFLVMNGAVTRVA